MKTTRERCIFFLFFFTDKEANLARVCPWQAFPAQSIICEEGSGLYYKHIMIVIDTASVIGK